MRINALDMASLNCKGLAVGSEVSPFQRGLANLADWLAHRLAAQIHSQKLHHYSYDVNELKLHVYSGCFCASPSPIYPAPVFVKAWLKLPQVLHNTKHAICFLSVMLGRLQRYALRHASHRAIAGA